MKHLEGFHVTKLSGSEEAKDEGVVGPEEVEVRPRRRHLLNCLDVVTASFRIFVQFVFRHLKIAGGKPRGWGGRREM